MRNHARRCTRGNSVQNNVVLLSHEQVSTMSEGNEYSWVRFIVGAMSSRGRISRVDYFPDDRWLDAIALFDQLATKPPTQTTGPHSW